MSSKVKIIGQGDNVEARVHKPADVNHSGTPGLVVYTHPLEVGDPLLLFLEDETGNVDQNVNASGAGTLTGIYDGGDTPLWTASVLVGSWALSSTDQANTGTQSLDATGTRNGDTVSFDNGSPLTVTDYTSVRGFIYVTSWPSSGSKDFEIGLYSGNALIGSLVSLSAYVDRNLQDSWQPFEVPLSDFNIGATTFNEIRLDVKDSGKGNAPAAYFDDFSLVSAGTSGSAVYSVAAPAGETWVINRLKWTAVSNSSSIKYDEFFGIPELAAGYSFSFKSAGRVRQTFNARTFFDIAQYPNTTLDIISGTASIFEVYFDIPAEQQTLIGDFEQSIEMTVRDDLSSLLKFRATAQGYRRRTI